jgi:hypothetical protein
VLPVALTVVCHPDLGRVGERRILAEIERGADAEIGRLEPGFELPDSGRPGEPLGDPYLSRTPMRLRRSARGGVIVDCAETNTRVEADGDRLLTAHELPPQALDSGVVLLLANRIALLLHSLPEAAARGEVPYRHRKLEIARHLLRYLRRELLARDRVQLMADPGPYSQPWLPAPVVARLVGYTWPGEKLQLREVARRLVEEWMDHVHVGSEDHLEVLLHDTADPQVTWREDSGEDSSPFILADGVRRDSGDVSEKELMAALLANRWQIGPTARQLGISRPALFLMIDEMTTGSAKR